MNKQNNTSQEQKWGAEAILEEGKWFDLDVIRKIRIAKTYRIAQLDNELRNSRTIIESRLLIAAKKIGVSTPYIFEIDLKNATIIMESIDGDTIKDVLNSDIPDEDKISIVKEIGQLVGKLHSGEIVHGDLTTSNILLKKDKITFIDFGLGKFSSAVEDHAVDILLIKKCFTSTHTRKDRKFFDAFQEGYILTKENAKSVLKRAVKVEARGRHLKEDQVKGDYLIS